MYGHARGIRTAESTRRIASNDDSGLTNRRPHDLDVTAIAVKRASSCAHRFDASSGSVDFPSQSSTVGEVGHTIALGGGGTHRRSDILESTMSRPSRFWWKGTLFRL